MMFLSSCFSARLKRPAKDPVPYSKEALRQDLTAGANCLGGVSVQSRSQRDLRLFQRRVRSGDVVGGRRSGHQPGTLGATTAAVWICQRTTNRSRRSSCAPLIVKSGQADAIQVVARAAVRSGVQDELLSRLPRSFSARAASTNVLRGSPAASGEALVADRWTCIQCNVNREPCPAAVGQQP